MKKLFQKLTSAGTGMSTATKDQSRPSQARSGSISNFNFNSSLRRLSLSSSISLPRITVLRGGYNIDLQKVDSSFTKLHKAVYLNQRDRVKKYIAYNGGVMVNARDSFGRSPLHFAAVNGNLVVINMLLRTAANLNYRDSEGKSPLMKAVECGHQEVLQVLLDAGADVDLADNLHGNTALHWALVNGNLECSLYIIRNALIIDYNKRNHVSCCL